MKNVLRIILAAAALLLPARGAQLITDGTLRGTTTVPSGSTFTVASGGTMNISSATLTLPARLDIPSLSGQSGLVLSNNGSVLNWTAAGAGSGTVTSFSAGDLSPLFTTSEATATTTPALTFTLSNASANAFFSGPTSGSAAAPTFRAVVGADITAALGVANVIAYGATGDGVTNDRAAIQTALDSAYGTVYFPDGTYLISTVNPDVSGAGLRIPSNKRLVLSQGATLKRGTNSITGFLINKADGVTAYTANSNIIIEGGTIDGNSATFTTNATLVAFGHATNVTIRDCIIKDAPSWHLIEFNAVKRGTVERVQLSGCPSNEAIQLDYMGASGQFPWFGPYNNSYKCENITPAVDPPIPVDIAPVVVRLVNAPVDGVVPPIAPGAAKVAPPRLLALRFATLVVLATTSGAVPVAIVEVYCVADTVLAKVAA